MAAVDLRQDLIVSIPHSLPSLPPWVRELLSSWGVSLCGDNSCMFGSPGGMATNGGCRCLERLNGSRLSSEQRVFVRKLAYVLRYVAAKVPDA